MDKRGIDSSIKDMDYIKLKWRTLPANLKAGMGSEELMKVLPPLVEEWSKKYSWRIVKAKIFEYLCHYSAIDISSNDWFPTFADWTFAPKTNSHKRTRRFGHPTNSIIDARRDYILNNADEDYKNLLKKGSGARWSSYLDFDHSAPDWDEIIKLGFPGMAKRLSKYHKDTDYYHSLEITTKAIEHLFDRFISLGKERLQELDDESYQYTRMFKVISSLERLKTDTPQGALDILMFVYLFWTLSEQFEAIQVRTLGNLDRIITPYYLNDLSEKRTTKEEFTEQIKHFWLQWGAIDNYFGQPVYFGGTKSDGTSEYNEVSRIMLTVHDELALPTPKLHLKVGKTTPDWLWNQSLDMIRRQRSISFLGEEPHTKVIKSMGYTDEQARTFLIWGCYEWAIKDSANDIFGAAINTVKPIEELLSEARTGSFTADNFEDLKAKYLQRLAAVIDEAKQCVMLGEKYRKEINPSLLFSLATEHSVKTGMDAVIDGTKNGNNTSLWMVGLGTSIDALMAIDELVYRNKEVSLSKLGEIMEANWDGHEALRLRISRSKCKWGNNAPQANQVGEEIVNKVFAPINGQDNGRGGKFKISGHVALWFISLGRGTGATPNGRFKGEELSKNISPVMGADTEGATALIESVSHLDARNLSGDFPLDVALLPDVVSGENGLKFLRTIIEKYFENGGLVIQFNIVAPETLRDAQAHPEKYENLQIRVCGWNVRWNDLSKVEQDAYIIRAEAQG